MIELKLTDQEVYDLLNIVRDFRYYTILRMKPKNYRKNSKQSKIIDNLLRVLTSRGVLENVCENF